MRLLVATFCVFFTSSLAAQDWVKVTLRDGRVLEGELKSDVDERYVILVDGVVQEFDGSDIVSLEKLPAPPPKKTVTTPTSVPEVRRLIEEAKDGPKTADLLARALRGAAESEQKALLETVRATIEKGAPVVFVIEFAEALAKDAELQADHKATTAQTVEALGHREEKEHPTWAWKLYRAVATLDPARAEPLRESRRTLTLLDARACLQAGDFDRALAAAEEALLLAPNLAEALQIREDARFRKIRGEVETAAPENRTRMLEDYLKEAKKDEYRKWAEGELVKGPARETSTLVLCDDLKKFYPATAGNFWKYRVGGIDERKSEDDKEKKKEENAIYHLVSLDEVRLEDGHLRLYFTDQRIFKNYKTETVFQRVADATSIFPTMEFEMYGEEPFPELRFPAKVGASWDVNYDSRKLSREVTSLTATAQTPAGTFRDCLEVTYTSSRNDQGKETKIVSRSYYAPRVGLVKLQFDHPMFRKENRVLVEFAVK